MTILARRVTVAAAPIWQGCAGMHQPGVAATGSRTLHAPGLPLA